MDIVILSIWGNGNSKMNTCRFAGVVVAFQSNQLPNPVVKVEVPGHDVHEVTASHTINPRFEDAVRTLSNSQRLG